MLTPDNYLISAKMLRGYTSRIFNEIDRIGNWKSYISHTCLKLSHMF